MANPGASAAPAGRVRWRRRLLFGALVVLVLLVSLHAFGVRATVTGTAVLGGLALIGFVIYRLPHLRRHFSRGGGGRGLGSLNFPSQVAARQRRKRFSLFRGRGGAAGSSGGGGGGGRRSGLPKIFRGHRRRSGAGSSLGTAGSGGRSGAGGRSRSGIFRRRRGSGSLGGGGGGRSGAGGRSRSGIFRRGSGARRGSASTGGGTGSRRRGSGIFRRGRGRGSGGRGSPGGTGARRGHLPVWRRRPVRGSTSTGRRGSGRRTGSGGRSPRRRWFAPWRRRPARGSTSTGGGKGPKRKTGGGKGPKRKTGGGKGRGRRPAASTGGAPGPRRGSGSWRRPSWRRPVARARWNRANPVNPGHRRWYAPWRRTGPAAAGMPGTGTAGPGFWRRSFHRIAGTPAQRNSNRLTRISRRGRVRAARRRTAANPYARHSRWQNWRAHRRWYARNRNQRGWRDRIARRWHSRRGAHRGLGFGGARQVGRPPRPLLAGLRNSPGLRRFAGSPLGRGAAWLDRRRADRWLRRQRRYAPAGVMRPAAPRPGTPGHRLLQASVSLIPAGTPQTGGRADTTAMAAQIRVNGAHEFTDTQDIHDTLTGAHGIVAALHDAMAGWGDAAAGTGLHPVYAEALHRVAGHMAEVADQLEGVTSSGVTRGPGG